MLSIFPTPCEVTENIADFFEGIFADCECEFRTIRRLSGEEDEVSRLVDFVFRTKDIANGPYPLQRGLPPDIGMFGGRVMGVDVLADQFPVRLRKTFDGFPCVEEVEDIDGGMGAV